MNGSAEILVVLAAAAIGAALFERARLPAVAGFLVAGAAVGPGGFGLVSDAERVRVLAELGVALLLFEVGLELPLVELRSSWRSAVLSGALQVVVTLISVAALGVFLGLSLPVAILIGMLVSMSSTALVLRVLGQQGELDAPHGRLVLGILLFQDLCIVPFLLALPMLTGEVPPQAGALLLATATALAKLALLAAAARFIAPWLLERIAHLRSPDLFSLCAFLLAVGSAIVSERIGLTLAVGAFIAGLVLNASPYATQLFAEVAPLRGVLLGVFFTAVGMLLEPARALQAWLGVLLWLAGVVLLKSAVVVAIAALVARSGVATAVRTGLALAQTGEFSFVLAASATAAGLLTGDLSVIFLAGSILTLMATPFLIRSADRVARIVALAEPLPEPVDEGVADHAIIAGYGLAGRTLARVLRVLAIPYRVVDANAHTVAAARDEGEAIVFGDATRPAVLDRLGVRRARLVSIATSDPSATRAAVETVRRLAPEVYIVARTRYVKDLDALFERGASEVVAEEFESTIDLLSRVLRRFGVAEPAIDRFADKLRQEGYEFLREPYALDPWLGEVLREVPMQWIEVSQQAPAERSIAELAVRKRTGASILAVRRGGTLLPNPEPGFRLRPRDELLVLCSAAQLESLRELLASDTAA